MIITIAQVKGGVGKTTAAIHVAAFMQTLAPTVFVDGDIVRASSKWAQRGAGIGLPFKVVPIGRLAKHVRDFEHVIIDTGWCSDHWLNYPPSIGDLRRWAHC
jgi:chromosome partitioning protein